MCVCVCTNTHTHTHTHTSTSISIAHPAGLLSPLMCVTLTHLQVKALRPVFFFHFLSSGTIRKKSLLLGGSRSGWQNEKQHKFNKSAVLISNYVQILCDVFSWKWFRKKGLDLSLSFSDRRKTCQKAPGR